MKKKPAKITMSKLPVWMRKYESDRWFGAAATVSFPSPSGSFYTETKNVAHPGVPLHDFGLSEAETEKIAHAFEKLGPDVFNRMLSIALKKINRSSPKTSRTSKNNAKKCEPLAEPCRGNERPGRVKQSIPPVQQEGANSSHVSTDKEIARLKDTIRDLMDAVNSIDACNDALKVIKKSGEGIISDMRITVGEIVYCESGVSVPGYPNFRIAELDDPRPGRTLRDNPHAPIDFVITLIRMAATVGMLLERARAETIRYNAEEKHRLVADAHTGGEVTRKKYQAHPAEKYAAELVEIHIKKPKINFTQARREVADALKVKERTAKKYLPRKPENW